MKLPSLNVSNDQITMVNNFLGLNMNLNISDSEFSDMLNMTNDYFPAIGTRKSRGMIRVLTNPQGALGGNALSYVDNDKFYYDESYVCDLSAGGERQLVAMGAYIVIFPDGVIYNTHTREVTYVENKITSSVAPVFTLCKLDGTNFDDSNTTTSSSEPGDHSKPYWIDTSADPVVIKMWSDNTNSWNPIGTTYVKVAATGIGVGFKAYDAARFEDVDNSPAIYNGQDFNQTNIIYDRGDDFIVIAGLINKVFTNSKPITVSREMPQMDYVCEMGNRLFGCSSSKHEVYASKLGDPTNWNCFAGLDSDSYAATVGMNDEFTGCAAYSGYVFFFMDGGYHKMYGTKPSNFEIVWKPGRGVQNGSYKSICVVNNYLMFKSREGVCLFDGATRLVSEKLGSTPLYDAVAGSYRDKYYVSMRDADYNWRIYVYDTTKNTWCIENEMELLYCAYADGGMYMIDRTGQLYLVNQERMIVKRFPREDIYPMLDSYPGYETLGDFEPTFEWMVESGDIGLNSPYQKYIKRFDVRLTIEPEAFIRFEVSYDSTDDWQVLMNYNATKERSFTIPLYVQRHDHMRLRISGYGNIMIYSIAKVTEEGSDT